ncbi:DODA-type extradiol aromatic ring-opening family dioxygenase [Sulfobacillus harzensis]|uniref:Dioxygenase n=1 Tax=Sulfobacillus harzensis TaxID=2729629 RepID=A0A7Y0Q1C9_9FIRM|nr:class III extradiol ring-cleavage dioxygenase [Sulfobacillus harzensis]NMP21963.1 dioxygenase [Sulfobacillus harzensis]
MRPSLFIAHGSPMIAIEESPYGEFLDQLGRRLEHPRAVVIFSAHWESPVQQVSAVSQYTTIYDFGGFPDELYRVVYPAPGDPALAEEIQNLLAQANIAAERDRSRGLDHGAWTLLKRLFPEASVPVVAMSVNARLSPREQFAIGQALAPLRDHDILIIGSGVTVHNFQILGMGHSRELQAAVKAFQRWLDDKLSQWDLEALFDYEHQAPHARLAVPQNGQEHFAPLFYAMGAAGTPDSIEILHESWMWNVMANTVFQFA